MRPATLSLAVIVSLLCLPNASMAQSSWLVDPVSELFNSTTAPHPTYQDVEQWRQAHHPVRYEAPRRHHRAQRIAIGNKRMIRAKAKVTILDRDHIVIELTRPNIGVSEGATTSSR
jgi:hypothetical protein